MPEHNLPIAVVARETGISADLLRKWETRHDFPQPRRSEAGIRGYPLEQVKTLRAIKRLIDSGVRPGEAIRRCTTGESESLAAPEPALRHGVIQACLDAIRAHDAQRLHTLLDRNLISLGAHGFIVQTATPLAAAVGKEWMQGRLRVHEEHLFSATLSALLAELHRRLHQTGGHPRALLTTPPGELHTLGLDMVRTLFAEVGAHCVSLGAQTPLLEMADAVTAYDIDVLALSFSAAYPARLLAAELMELRAVLPPDLPIWIGGAGTLAVSNLPPGVEAFVAAADAAKALRRLRTRRTAAERIT